ncbi:CoA transferase [Streptomyces rapamycinicus]|uniref:Carnitine dehydratase n=2 Tax=Streptomyces rapamycinicus TaxID=1226757 RepID=A0A0A0NCL8_STRRN|nr:CoA transferase [Streptomyces rapamycinicus]AGP57212.1 CoA-transferase [Streptomyces rapamycinicus NRRL 5491]MBB4784853.1 crotonobetainyl-CoA:carnitine CoA-transferase CaiB-like acyl-CoA transferase [Streptomyces rapamycinicus]RLV79670.1 carnitine dehydratase [Streptomyces rapamycinicus NRRL 5491]UTO65104.1 CoA transferase [Streptomyces rapamycinicus]UTP33060.1 CoA transferase [Streptomyces rapamycinicus NRRL 5491]
MTRSDAPPPDTRDAATAHAWAALGGDPALLEQVTYRPVSGGLPAQLPVAELARATVGVCSLAAAELGARRSGGAVPAVRVDEGAVATAFVSERHLRIDGRKPTNFAPLSGFWRAADGWVRTHANYPHHRARLLTALGLPGDSGPDELAAALAARPARAIQETVYAAGGLAVAVAEPEESEIPLAALPLIESRRAGEGTPRRLREVPPPASGALPVSGALPASGALPVSGVRVLDLTRVIAGPVATRTLALLGADVLRIDSPRLPEDPDAHADTGFGKRSAALDLAAPGDRRTFEALLADADVVVTGYRPGALDHFGLAPDALLERHPGLVVAQLCAWGWSGPWAGRRGFDSLVQAATGIAAIEADADGRPGALPAQALDHGTGYLLAAAVLRALTERQEIGGGHHLRLSLAGTASWLTHGIAPAALADGPAHDPAPWLAETASDLGTLHHARSPIATPDGPLAWPRPPGRLGADAPRWL